MSMLHKFVTYVLTYTLTHLLTAPETTWGRQGRTALWISNHTGEINKRTNCFTTAKHTRSTFRSHLMQNTLAKMSSICSQLISARVVSVNIQSISARSSSRNGIRRNLHHVVTSTKNVATITPCKTTALTVTACSLTTHDLRRSMKNICQLKSTRWWQSAELGIMGTYPHKPNKCSVCNAVKWVGFNVPLNTL